MIKTKEHNIPLQTIQQSLELYKNLHAPISNFGMDVFNPKFKPEGIALVANSGLPSKFETNSLGSPHKKRQVNLMYNLPFLFL
jgi:hypothetical protein